MLTLAKLCGSILLALNNTAQTPRASGGIGRLAGFRCQCSQGRAGSTPASRTKERHDKVVSFFFSFIPLSIQQICKQKKNDPRPVFQSGVILRSAWALPSVINLSFYRFSVPIILSRRFDSHLYQRTVCGSLPYMTTAFGELASLDVGSFPVFNFRGESLVHWTHPFCI